MRRTMIILPVAVLILAASCASTDWEARYLEQQQHSLALEEQNEEVGQQLAEGEAALEEARREMGQTQSSVEILSRKVQVLKRLPPPAPLVVKPPVDEDVARMEAELARLKREYGDLVRLTPEGNIEITLKSDVTFSSGSRELTSKGKQVLDSVAGELQGQFAGHVVRVIGHTDTDPIRKSPYKDNWELGAERALVVTRYLSSTHGIDPSRLIAASRGENAPVDDNTSKQSKSKNRRVEIVVVIPKKTLIGDASAQK